MGLSARSAPLLVALPSALASRGRRRVADHLRLLLFHSALQALEASVATAPAEVPRSLAEIETARMAQTTA